MDFEDEPVEKENVKKALEEYAETLKKRSQLPEARLLQKEFSFEELNIELQSKDTLDDTRFNDIRSDLLLFLKKKLRNKQLKISVKIEKEKTENVVYTSQDKFDYLAKQNPALLDLKNRLGLEFEY